MDYDEYRKLANRALNKQKRLKAAKQKAGTIINDARDCHSFLKKKAKPSSWKGATAKKYDSLISSMNSSAKSFISAMDAVRDGYNREEAEAHKSYVYFDGLFRKAKAEIENIVN